MSEVVRELTDREEVLLAAMFAEVALWSEEIQSLVKQHAEALIHKARADVILAHALQLAYGEGVSDVRFDMDTHTFVKKEVAPEPAAKT